MQHAASTIADTHSDPELELKLRPFQAEEEKKLLQNDSSGITWDMGLGKTAITARQIGLRNLKRILVIAPDNAFSIWGAPSINYDKPTAIDWIKSVHPDAQVFVEPINGSPYERQIQWIRPYKNCVHIRIVTPEVFLRDWAKVTKISGIKGKKAKLIHLQPITNYNIPECVVYDEAHKKLRNKETQSFKLFQRWVTYYTPAHLFLLTGTPGHEPKHFWTLLNLIAPHKAQFRSYWKFVGEFHQLDDTGFGIEVNEPRNLPKFHNVLRQYFSVVKEEDVEGERPPLTRELLPITMDADQQKLYRDFYNDLSSWVQQDDKLLFAQNEFVQMTRFRQILVCPRILSPSLSVGSAIKDFAETIEPKLHPVVIFTPFKAAFEHFGKYLLEHNFPLVLSFYGGMGTDERDHKLKLFREHNAVAICTIHYAQSFSFEPATKCFFIGYDWDPDNNRQAEKRLHRLTTLNPITAYYYTYRSSIDSILSNRVNLKQQRMNLTIPSNLREILNDDHS